MSGRAWAETLLVVAAAVVLGFGIIEHNAKVAARAQLGPLRREAEAALQRAQASDGALEAARALATESAASMQRLQEQVRILGDSLRAAVTLTMVEVDVASVDLQDLIVQIRAILPPEAQPLADSASVRAATLTAANVRTAQAFETQRVAFEQFQAQTAITLTAKDAALAAAESSISEWQAVAAAERARAAAAEALTTPGVWSRIKTSLPFFSWEGTVAGVLGFGFGVAVTAHQ